jgi:hypothetical protein
MSGRVILLHSAKDACGAILPPSRSKCISFLDDTEHQRCKQVTPEGTTLYIAAFGVMAELNIGNGGLDR